MPYGKPQPQGEKYTLPEPARIAYNLFGKIRSKLAGKSANDRAQIAVFSRWAMR